VEKTSSPSEGSYFKDWSHRKLYFMTLYHQYRLLSGIVTDRPQTFSICPQFHSTLLDYPPQTIGSLFEKNFFENYDQDLMKKTFNRREWKALYPEMFLSLSKDFSNPTVFDYWGQNPQTPIVHLLKKAFKIHLERTEEQLQELCQYGQDDKTYVFENFITYMKEHPEYKETDSSIKSLMHIPLFLNMSLLISLKGHQNFSSKDQRMPSSKSVEETSIRLLPTYDHLFQTVSERSQTFWAIPYFEELMRRKQQVLLWKN
jgi:hypothetical protein